MMAPEDDAVHGEPKASAPAADATRNNQEETEAAGARRERAQSDAVRRNERESQRTATHELKTRLSVLNNRFLARKESRATSGGGDNGSPTRKPRPERRPEEKDVDDDDDSDRKPVRHVIEESALVVTRKRSSAASSAAGPVDKAKRKGKRDARDAASPRGDAATGALVLTPSVHVVPALALKRSKWTRELEEDAACGLFVEDERSELAQIASSTLVRLEERLQRELTAQERSTRGVPTHSVRLNDLLHMPHIEPIGTNSGFAKSHEAVSNHLRHHGQHPWQTALLEITIDRLVLDDHVSFSLADRIETQLRSLYVSYTHLLHAQPWSPLLQRVDAFVDACLRQAETNPDERRAWLAQTLLDAQTLVQSLGTLQQLHYQLSTKWHELQDCYRQPTLSNRASKLRLRHEKRAKSLELTSLRAFLELEDGESERTNQIRSKLMNRLDELETKDQYLHVVLALEAFAADAPTARAHTGSWRHPYKGPLSLVVGASPPKFYVALFINNKEVGRTKASRWLAATPNAKQPTHKTGAVGVVPIHESLRTQLHFFPDSVTVKVFECGLCTDTLLSTTSIPLVVPGQDLVDSGSLSDTRNRVSAASLAPSSEWYQFSSVNAMPRSRWHETFLNSTLFANFRRHPHGRVRVEVAWIAPFGDNHPFHHSDNQREGDGDEDRALEATQVVLPPRRLPVAARDNAKLVGPRVDRRRLYQTPGDDEQVGGHNHNARHAGFSYERDFLVHIEDTNNQLTVDRNDPDNAAVVRLQDHVRTQSTLLKQRDVFRANSLVYDATALIATPSFGTGRAALTRRNLLLQLRDREHVAKHGTSMALANASQDVTGKKWDHDAFDEPLPLSEHAIATNAKFLGLLRPEIPAFDYRQRLDDALATDGTSRFSLERERKLQLLKLQDFVDRVRASKLARVHNKALASSGKQRDRTKTLATIIQEQPMPLLPGAIDLSGLGTLFSRRRRLRPRVETRSTPATMADWPRHCMLYVQIKSATNVPVRVTAGRKGAQVTQPKEPKRSKSPTFGGGAVDDDDDDTQRQKQQSGDKQTGEAAADSSHVFVEIVFQGKRRRTTATHVRTTGAVWMETVALPFNAPQDDWSPDSLQKAPDIVRLSLFDQLVRTSSADGGDDAFLMLSRETKDAGGGVGDDHVQQQRTQSLHQENRFLGSLEVPFATLYHNHGTLDATLRCEMPVVNVGYVNGKHSTSSGSDETGDEMHHGAMATAGGATSLGADRDDDLVLQSSRDATFLSVMMTLDPLLPMPTKAFEENPFSAGDDYAALAAYASHWKTTTQQLNAATKHRDFHVFVRSLGHGQTFLTRYVAPQIPPPLVEASNNRSNQFTVAQLVRFVRLIPFLEDWQLFDDGGELDVWTTSQELLELNAGDFEEHAVLLCNFFNWLDKDEVNRRSFLVLATAVPEGKTVYVLRQDSYKIPQRSVLWNASTGVGYSVLDDRCPVLDISLIVSSENVYANIQPGKRLSEMNWDIESNAKAWKPFFHGSHKKEQFTLPTVQTTQLVYQQTPRDFVEQVEAELRESLKLEIRRWRSIKFTTTFNMDLSMKLRAQLERLELAKLNGERESSGSRKLKKDDRDQSAKDPVAELLRTRRVSGMPLNTNFTDTSKVISMVKSTNIYWNDHPEVEFGFAVYVHAYPNCVLSVWVYLVAVEPIE